MEQQQLLAEDRCALDVEVADLVAEQLVDGTEIDLARVASQASVGVEVPGEPAVAVLPRSGSDAEQDPVGTSLARRQDGQRLEVGLVLRALLGIGGDLAAERPDELPRLFVRQVEDGEVVGLVADHVDVAPAPGDARRRGDVGGRPRPRAPRASGRGGDRAAARRDPRARRDANPQSQPSHASVRFQRFAADATDANELRRVIYGHGSDHHPAQLRDRNRGDRPRQGLELLHLDDRRHRPAGCSA